MKTLPLKAIRVIADVLEIPFADLVWVELTPEVARVARYVNGRMKVELVQFKEQPDV